MSRKSTGTVRLLRNDDGELQWHAKWTRADGTRTDWEPLNPAVAVDEATSKAEAADPGSRKLMAVSFSLFGLGTLRRMKAPRSTHSRIV